MKLHFAIAAAILGAASVANAGASLSAENGYVSIGGYSEQKAYVKNSSNVLNDAIGASTTAMQNLSTNAGKVDITGHSYQTTNVDYGTVKNEAKGDYSVAIQNLSSNTGEVKIGGSSEQTTSVRSGSKVENLADAPSTFAAQSLASNFGNVAIKGGSKQLVDVSAYSTVHNHAYGVNSAARQNLATNTSCGATCVDTTGGYKGRN